MKKLITIILVVLILSLLNSSYASEKVIRNSYEYAKLNFIYLKIINDKSGEYESSTIINFFYAKGGVGTIKTRKGILGIDASNDAFKDFIKKYDQRKSIPDYLSEISILSILGEDGWEIIYYSDAPAKYRNETGPQSKYLLKRIK